MGAGLGSGNFEINRCEIVEYGRAKRASEGRCLGMYTVSPSPIYSDSQSRKFDPIAPSPISPEKTWGSPCGGFPQPIGNSNKFFTPIASKYSRRAVSCSTQANWGLRIAIIPQK